VRNTITQFAEKSSTKAYQQDGFGMGYLETFKIDQSGTITGVYSNGANRTLGQIAMASFSNQGGLEKAPKNTYVQSNNSGCARISAFPASREGQDDRGRARDVKRRPDRPVNGHDRYPARVPGELQDDTDLRYDARHRV
jgi:flagellar hook protein FlgE